ncbi:hypothetical protein ACO0LO_02385 [Undibacterium sp. TJN25]|uniref:hypothetical protein n=1 Tax=Undibacterium sp. TJN25 TaxID=3413056 RepID=UPI003BF3E146
MYAKAFADEKYIRGKRLVAYDSSRFTMIAAASRKQQRKALLPSSTLIFLVFAHPTQKNNDIVKK